MAAQTRVVDNRSPVVKTPYDNFLLSSPVNNAAKLRTRYEKMETGYGTIQATDYAVGDTLVFEFPSKSIIHAKFVASTGAFLFLLSRKLMTDTVILVNVFFLKISMYSGVRS